MNFSTLTALEVVIIGFAPAEIILRSLKHLVAGIFHGKLKLGFILNTGENLVDDLGIKERCEELRIELVKSNHG